MLKKLALVASLGLLLVACESEAERQAKADQKAYQEKYAKAKALFEERCRTAGVVIHRTVKDVEGIELSKIRQPIPWGGKEYFDPMFPGAAMAGEMSGDRYVWQFLQDENRYVANPGRRGTLGFPNDTPAANQLQPIRGYRFVEFIDASGKRIHCRPTGNPTPKGIEDLMRCVPTPQSNTKYALDFEDIVNPEDRGLWVAGTKLKVTEKQTGEVVAELKRFVWDPGFGGGSTGRWPWQHANSRASQRCPSDVNQPLHHDSRYFIDQILIPKQGTPGTP